MSASSSVVPAPVDKPMTPSPPCLAVITGLGCVSPLGVGGDDFVTNILRTNRSAIGPLRNFSTQGLACRLGAEIPAACLPDVEEARRWSRLSYMTVTACRQAVVEAGFDTSPMLSQCGLVVGTEFGDLRSTEAFVCGFLRKGPLGLSPLLFPNTVMNAMAGATSIALGLKGPMLTLNQYGVAGEVAVARAIALITAGRAPAVIACGVDELCATLYETLALLQVPSPHDGGKKPVGRSTVGIMALSWAKAPPPCSSKPLPRPRHAGPRSWPKCGASVGAACRCVPIAILCRTRWRRESSIRRWRQVRSLPTR